MLKLESHCKFFLNSIYNDKYSKLKLSFICRDKAGGYGIQGIGGCLVEKVNGDFYTVVGLPLYSTIKHLNNLFCEAWHGE